MIYYLFMIPALIISLLAQMYLKSTYAKTSKMLTSNGMTGAQAARFILDSNGLNDVQIEAVQGQLSDHYDPSAKVVRLSQGVFNVPSVAAVGIASHECGHAIQHNVGYAPLKFRNAIIPLTNIGSKLSFPIILLGVFFNSANLIDIGILAFSLMTVFQLITLPVEFNASRRALKIIDQTNMLQTGAEYNAAKSTLTSAALTYVAALIGSISQLLYMLSFRPKNNRR